MKSLKRTLSLVLALVMVLGLFGGLSMTASASDYTDDADIQYKEAVDVLTAIGAIDGMGDGTFQPTGKIRRGDAAKLITYTVLGKEAAESLPAGVSSSFSDVGSNWDYAAPSIEYLVKAGVIDGMGDGTFHPDDYINGYAITKMLLCSLGYGAKGEYTGTGWDLKVAIDASKYGILEDRVKGSANLSADATREEVALYCLNTIQKNEVTYVSALDIYDDGSVLGGKTTTMLGTIYKGELATEKAIDTDTGDAGYTDSLGRPSNRWTYKGEKVGEYAINPVRVYTAKQTSVTKLASDLKGLFIAVDSTKPQTAKVELNGDTQVEFKAANNNIPADPAALAKAIIDRVGDGTDAKNDSDNITGNGVTVAVYARESGRVVAICAVQTDIAQVTAVNPVSGEVSLELTGKGHIGDANVYTIAKNNDLYDKVSSLAEGDRVLVTLVNSTGTNYVIGEVSIPEKVTGKVSVSTASGTYTIDGKSYGIAKARTDAAQQMAINPSADDEYDVWLDTNGFIIDAKKVTPDAGSDMVYVLKAFQKVAGEEVVNMARVVRTNGETEDLAYYSVGGSSTTAPSAGEVYKAKFDAARGAYAFTSDNEDASSKNSGGAEKLTNEQALKLVTVRGGSGTKIDAGDKQLNKSIAGDDGSNYYDNFYASDVKFIYIDENGGVSTHTGVEAVTFDKNVTTASWAVAEGTPEARITAVFFSKQYAEGSIDTSKLAYQPNETAVAKQLMETTTGRTVTVSVYQFYTGTDTEPTNIAITNDATTPVLQGHFYQLREDPSIKDAFQAVEFKGENSKTMPVVWNKTNNAVVGHAGKVTGTLVELNRDNAGSGSSGYVEFKDAVVIDARSEAARESKTINTASAAKFFGNLDSYESVSFGYVYNTDTNNASVIYVMEVGTKLVPTTIEAATDAVGKVSGNTLTTDKGDKYAIKAWAVENDKIYVTVTAVSQKTSATSGSTEITISAKTSEGGTATKLTTGTAPSGNKGMTVSSGTISVSAKDFTVGESITVSGSVSASKTAIIEVGVTEKA